MTTKIEFIKPSATLMQETLVPVPVHVLQKIGRICWKSEDRIDGSLEQAEKFCLMLMSKEHFSVLEHVSASAKFICDRGVSHEIVRHRLASYSQESTRYCNYGKANAMKYIVPCWLKDVIVPGFYTRDEDLHSWRDEAGDIVGWHPRDEDLHSWRDEAGDIVGWHPTVETWADNLWWTAVAYNTLLEDDWTPQQARSVLPNALKTELVMTANIREWLHFFALRCSRAAHPQMREVANELLVQMYEWCPTIFHKVLTDGVREMIPD